MPEFLYRIQERHRQFFSNRVDIRQGQHAPFFSASTLSESTETLGGWPIIEEYLSHRRDREQQVLDALAAGDHDAMTMVKRIYVGYPESLYSAAAQSVTSHLKKLERDGRVQSNDDQTLWALA